MTNELKERLQAMNPEPFGESSADELASVLAVIEARRSTMTIEKTTGQEAFTARPQSIWARPAAVFVGMAVIVLLFVGGGALLGSNTEEPVADTAPTSTVPSTTTAAPTTVAPPMTTAAETPTVPPATQAQPISPMMWDQVVNESVLNGTVWALAHNEDVLVGVGDDTRPTMGWLGPDDSPNVIVWVSNDGEAWSRIDDPALFGGEGIQQAFKIAAGPLGFIISGEDVRNTVLWFSPDGYSWQRTFEDDFETSGTVEGLSVVAGGPGWIALDDALNSGDPVYISNDGRSWTAVSEPAYADELRRIFTETVEDVREPISAPRSGYDWQYAWDRDRVVANQYTGYATLWSSLDAGATWSRVDPEQDAFSGFPRPWLLSIDQFNDLTVVAGNGIWLGLMP